MPTRSLAGPALPTRRRRQHGRARADARAHRRGSAGAPLRAAPHRPRRIAFTSAAVLALSLASASPAATQVVRGTVIEENTDDVIDGALVTLLSESGDSIAAAVSDQGVFVLNAPRTGRYRLRAQRLGYATTETEPLQLEAGLESIVTIVLGTDAVPLEPLRVRGSRMPLHPQFEDIEERMRLGFGRFLTREDIHMQPGAKIPDLLRRVPGARISATRFGDVVVSLRARASTRELPPESTRVLAFKAANPCAPKLYVDGVPWVLPHNIYSDTATGAPQDAMYKNEDFMALAGADVEVIEVYNGPASLPGIYGGSDAECGVVAVWMRRTHEQAVFDPRELRPSARDGIGFPDVALAAGAYAIGGPDAPAAGPVLEAAARLPIAPPIWLGLFARRGTHRIPAEALDALTSTLSSSTYVLPAGARGLTLWVAGVESGIDLPPLGRVQPSISARVQGARRGFALNSANVGNPEIPVTSYGWGAGLAIGFELPLIHRLTATGALGIDWLFFSGYREIERDWNRTAADWRGTALRLGVEYRSSR